MDKNLNSPNADCPRLMSRRAWLRRVVFGSAGLAAVSALVVPDADAVVTAYSGSKDGSSSRAATDNSSGKKRKVGSIARGEAVACIQCDGCMPCGYGVDIPGIFAFWNEELKEGRVPDLRDGVDMESVEFSRKAKAFLRRYDRQIPDKHQAHRCIRCWHCVNSCSQRILIVNELEAMTGITDRLRDWECCH